MVNTFALSWNTIELHYWFNEGSHVMNAVVFNKCELRDDIKKLIVKDETRTLELKKTTGKLYKGVETACAFLNSDGGWLMFGITPSLK